MVVVVVVVVVVGVVVVVVVVVVEVVVVVVVDVVDVVVVGRCISSFMQRGALVFWVHAQLEVSLSFYIVFYFVYIM